MGKYRPLEEQPTPNEGDEPEIPSDATVVRQVRLAWVWSSAPWLAIIFFIYYFQFIPLEEVSVLLVVLVVVIPRFMGQRRTSYTITEQSLIYQRGGMFGVQRIPIPITRLKDVRSRSGLFGRTLGYQTVDVMLDNEAVVNLSYVPLTQDVVGQLKELIEEAAEYQEQDGAPSDLDDPLEDEDPHLTDQGHRPPRT